MIARLDTGGGGRGTVSFRFCRPVTVRVCERGLGAVPAGGMTVPLLLCESEGYDCAGVQQPGVLPGR